MEQKRALLDAAIDTFDGNCVMTVLLFIRKTLNHRESTWPLYVHGLSLYVYICMASLYVCIYVWPLSLYMCMHAYKHCEYQRVCVCGVFLLLQRSS